MHTHTYTHRHTYTYRHAYHITASFTFLHAPSFSFDVVIAEFEEWENAVAETAAAALQAWPQSDVFIIGHIRLPYPPLELPESSRIHVCTSAFVPFLTRVEQDIGSMFAKQFVVLLPDNCGITRPSLDLSPVFNLLDRNPDWSIIALPLAGARTVCSPLAFDHVRWTLNFSMATENSAILRRTSVDGWSRCSGIVDGPHVMVLRTSSLQQLSWQRYRPLALGIYI
jgi:hypothetical protein